MSDLKPCPHCGELPDIVETNSGFQALCSGCDMATYSDDWTEEKAIEIWNARHSGWISVDDRLPEDDDHIIMCTEHGDRFSGRGRVLIGNLNHPEPSVGKMTRYTHWQLMPPEPKQ